MLGYVAVLAGSAFSRMCALDILWFLRPFNQARTFTLTPSPSLDLMILKGDGDSVFKANMHTSALSSLPSLSLLESVALGWLREFSGPMATLSVSFRQSCSLFFYINVHVHVQTDSCAKTRKLEEVKTACLEINFVHSSPVQSSPVQWLVTPVLLSACTYIYTHTHVHVQVEHF